MAGSVMEQISAADNITIEMGDGHWRLIANGRVDPQVLFEARVGNPINYVSEFATTRRLPNDGSLPTEDIQRIVLGWSNSDESWHLGMLLEAELARIRGSRWCEIAHWPDPSTTVFSDIATRAGETLAQVVTRPFSLVPPKIQEPAEPLPPPLPELPLEVDDEWRLERSETGELELVQSAQRARATLRRMLWYGFWSVIYFVLVYASLTSGIAPPNPPFLPYLGLFSGLVLVGLALKNGYRLLTDVNRIVIDPRTREIRGQHGRRVRWRQPAAEIASIYVSQVVGKRRGKRPPVQYGELNLHLASSQFRHLLSTEHVTEYEAESPDADEGVTPLTTRDYTTSLQAAALHIGAALDLPVWYDRRAG
ncbi:MAG TPA: hypothetical protein VKY59_13340 [Spirillospora sp.]|nr:hypothetical protein [Spirillospora sp.]